MNRSHSIRAALVSTAVLAAPLLAEPPIGPDVVERLNLAQNGGFEAGDEMPAHWGRYPREQSETSRHRRDTTVARSGKASGLLDSRAPKPPGKPSIQWSQYGIPVADELALIASGWVRAEGVRPFRLGVHFYNDAGGHLGFTSVPVTEEPASDGWTPIRKRVDVPEGTGKIGFVAYAYHEGKTWFDDLAIIGTPTAKALRATPILNGKLDDSCWTKGRAITQFVEHTGAKFARNETFAWLAYDDKHIYVAFRCAHPPNAVLRCEKRSHDGSVWRDDSVEVFIDPRRGRESYVRIVANCAGVLRDASGRDASWQSGAKVAVQRGSSAWTVELAIPLKRLGLDLDVGSLWGINFVRNDRVAGETVTWSLGGIHEPSRFGKARIATDLLRYCRSQLARLAAEGRAKREALLAEIQNAPLPKAKRVALEKTLTSVAKRIERLRAIAKGTPTTQPWDAVRRIPDQLDRTIDEVRGDAVAALHQIGPEAATGPFRVVAAGSMHKVRRDGAARQGLLQKRVQLSAARDEVESFQLVVVPGSDEALRDVDVDAPPLTGPGGRIPISWRRVAYVETAKPKYPAEYVGWWPDPLLPAGSFDVPADRRQPVWISVHVPPDAKPGAYTGEVTIRSAGHSVTTPVALRVRAFRLPRPGTLATAFGLYAHVLSKPYFGKQHYRKVMPIDGYARWCKFLGRYRLAPKNVGREYVTSTKTNGGKQYDMTKLKAMLLPIDEAYYAPYSYSTYRFPSGPSIGKPGAASDPHVAAGQVKAWIDAWERHGMPRDVFLYGYDEPKPEHYEFLRAAYGEIREAAPGYPIMQTINHRNPEELVGLVDIWCPLTRSLEHPFYARRVRAGDTLWTYVCCSPVPPYANFFIDEPAIDHRMVFWQARQHGATGVLYWCVCWYDGLPVPREGAESESFPNVPIRSADHGTYKRFKTNGDGLIVYPGPDFTPYPSIRLEAIRDGIEDYEYLALLSRLVTQAKALPPDRRPDADTLEEAQALCRVPETISRTLTDFTKDPRVLLRRRTDVAEAIEQLRRIVGP